MKKTTVIKNSNKKTTKNNKPRNSSDYIKKNNKVQIIEGRVFKIDKDNIYVRFDNKIGICSLQNLTDYPDSLFKIVHLNSSYKFLLLGIVHEEKKITSTIAVKFYWKLSYKAIHPEELINKKKPIPTATHFTTLNNHLQGCLQKTIADENVKNKIFIINFKKLYNFLTDKNNQKI